MRLRKAVIALLERSVNPLLNQCRQSRHPASEDDRDIDTIGVLYGPDGQQIAEDDDSGDGHEFHDSLRLSRPDSIL